MIASLQGPCLGKLHLSTWISNFLNSRNTEEWNGGRTLVNIPNIPLASFTIPARRRYLPVLVLRNLS